jgi:hypothetical protein
VWRLTQAGWHVRFDPSVQVTHQARTQPVEWITRRFQYGTSAADLAKRHPGKLAPVRASAWNVAVLVFLAAGRPRIAVATATAASALLLRRLALPGADALLAPATVATGIVADGAATGHALRREWWPMGALCLLFAHRSRAARAGAVAMLAPIAWEYATKRPPVDPLGYAALRVVEDAAYGSGVLVSACRSRTIDPLRPQIRLPFIQLDLAARPRRSRSHRPFSSRHEDDSHPGHVGSCPNLLDVGEGHRICCHGDGAGVDFGNERRKFGEISPRRDSSLARRRVRRRLAP